LYINKQIKNINIKKKFKKLKIPLHIICQCCKCKSIFILHLWAVSINHKNANKFEYICCHFDVKIDHESNIGFFGLGWSNHIIIKALDKKSNEKKIIIDHMFNDKFTERISDFKGNYPSNGFKVQEKMNSNLLLEQ